MGLLDWFFKPKKVEAEPDQTYPNRFCDGYRDKLQLNSITEDGGRGICPVCGKDCRRTKAGTSYWHIPAWR
tara:strand:- start:319 stop:531 length:213 start_codon:yes stop_codon:yes gene_type:complete